MGKDMAFSIGAVTIGALVFLFYISPPNWKLPRLDDWVEGAFETESDPPVVVLVVGTPENVDIMRKVVGSERIVASARNAFALDDGRIIASSLEAVGEPVTAAGWVDRPLEIVAPPKHREAPRGRPENEDAGASPGARPQLSQGDALLLLNQFD
jgi:hypothetical protein